jgi:DNA-binding CsgD family transcriptional regulator
MTDHYNLDSAAADKIIAGRGPRYAVRLGLRNDRYHVHLVDTAERAERIYDRALEEGGYLYGTTKVIPSQDPVDLAVLGRARYDALRTADEATATLRAAVLREAELGRAEAWIAREAGIDRMTVRKWLGK